MMDFSAGAGQSTGSDLIPNGQLAWCILNVRGVKPSKGGGQYIDVELTIDDGQPYARRKIWEMIGDPMFQANSEEYRNMGMVAISRILEAGRGAGPNNPQGYKLNGYQELHGLRVPVRIGINKGKDGYDDKNRVGEWLTPNPYSQSGHKEFQLLQQGVYNKAGKPAATQPQQSFGFGGQPQAQGNNGGAFGSQQNVDNRSQQNTTQSSESGFQQPQQAGANGAASAADQPASTGFASTTAATAASPSDQPSWLQQANGQ